MTPPTPILVAEDSRVIRAVVRRHLEAEGYLVDEAEDGVGALEASRRVLPAAILMDIEMPGMDGYQVLAALKADPATTDIPVVFLTGHTDTVDVVAGLHAGAHDYLRKPFEPAELLARVGAAVRTKKLQDELRARNDELDRISRTDALTGLPNRRHTEELLRMHAAASLRDGRLLSVIIFDIDHFKRINDTAGHEAGDAVLREFASRVTGSLRGGDAVGRWGGEEFLAVLPRADRDQARATGERIRGVICAQPMSTGNDHFAVTVSGGCASGLGHEVDELIQRADVALYAAKREGRNRIVVEGDDPACQTACADEATTGA